MMARSDSDVELSRRSYSSDEIDEIYELARFSIENGDLRRAEVIVSGLVEVAPDYVPAWLALCYVHLQNKVYDLALQSTQQALRLDPECVEGELFLVACLLSAGDYSGAGTHLGEVADCIQSGKVISPDVLRFYKMQLARYQNRGR